MPIPQSINLTLDPYEGVGMFKLGHSLYQTIQLIQTSNLKLKIVSNFDKSSSSSPTVIIVEEYGLKLVFNSIHQVLIFIEVYQFDLILFNKNNNVLNLNYKLPNFQKIYNKIFGPTYPGFIDEQDNYILSYEGIAFKFDLNNYTNSSKKLVQFINDNSQSIFCNSIYLFKSSSFNDFKENMVALTSNKPQQTKKIVEKVVIDMKTKLIEFKYNDVKSKKSSSFKAVIGKTTMHDVIENLGPPDDVLSTMNDKYHNYFKIGCDFCYDLAGNKNNGYSSVLKKINVHNNLINSLEFMKYEKLNWELKFKDEKALTATNFDSYSNISKNFNTICKPIFLNRNEYDLVNSLNKRYEVLNLNNSQQNFELIDYEDDIDEDDKSDLTCNDEVDISSGTSPISLEIKHDLSSETLAKNNCETSVSKNRSKDWGLTNLYFYQNVVFEVLIDNDEVSMISIF